MTERSGDAPAQHYGGAFLDRASDRRFDPAWLASAMAHDEARYLPLWRSRNRFHPGGHGATALPGRTGGDLQAIADEVVFLGVAEGRPLFAIDLSSRESEELQGWLPAGEWQDLRRFGPLLDRREAAWCAYARGMLHWHRAHRYCGHCGAPTESWRGGHVRVCTREACRRQIHPRTDPAVIMLVERPATAHSPAQCLLASHQRLPEAVYTTLAGFVEPGEQLEDTVAREVAEETGVRVERVRYFASQPWPFPAQLMVGFRAVAASVGIRVDPEEIRDARWFTASEIRAAGEWGDDASLQLPRADSIARQLIADWLQRSDAQR
ncbi:NAD(+) diphosphatase [Ectothiorhodospiraceae bacterium WFHF3C12]|nr:NAD(+) diphosphatase [Ectothiorhodospiraceae bacterium WFHF3C12]